MSVLCCNRLLPAVTPGQLLHVSNSWLNLLYAFLEVLEVEFRVSADGITHFLARMFSRRGFAPLSGRGSQCAHRASHLRRSGTWFLASWNVRTLLDVDGPIETARQRVDLEVVDERKIDQVVAVLGRYKVDMAALQET